MKPFFPDAPATRPALLRIATGSYALGLLLRYGPAYSRVVRNPPDRYEPVGPAALFPQALDPELIDVVMYTSMGLLVLYIIGFGHRLIAPFTAALVCFFFAYRTSWGKIYHSDNLLILQLMVLSITPAGSALSVDAFLERKGWLPWLRWPKLPSVDWRFGWSVQLVCFATMITYFLAGWAKVTGDLGFAWATADNLLAQIGKNAVQKEFLTSDGISSSVMLAYRMGALLGPMAVVALVLELFAPVFILHRVAGMIWSFLTWCMHAGIHLLMDISFWYPLWGVAFLPFFPVEKLLPPRWRGEAPPAG